MRFIQGDFLRAPPMAIRVPPVVLVPQVEKRWFRTNNYQQLRTINSHNVLYDT